MRVIFRNKVVNEFNVPNDRHKNYRNKQDRLHNEWLARKQARDEKIARGEDGGPEERDPTAEVEIGALSVLKFLLYTVVIVLLSGKFLTGSYLWEYEGRWAQLKTYWPVS